MKLDAIDTFVLLIFVAAGQYFLIRAAVKHAIISARKEK